MGGKRGVRASGEEDQDEIGAPHFPEFIIICMENLDFTGRVADGSVCVVCLQK